MEISHYNTLHRYIFPYIDSNMYILVENGEAIVIDPHISSDADCCLKENHVSKVTILLTHEHFDHICGVPWFRRHYDTKVVCQQEALDLKRQKHFNRPLVVSLILADRGEEKKIKELENEYAEIQPLTAELSYKDQLDISWQEHSLHMEHIPGHSPASSLIILDKNDVFTGDSLIPDVETIVRWPWSNAEIYQEKVVPRLQQIPGECMIYPGHRNAAKMSDLIYKKGVFSLKIKGD